MCQRIMIAPEDDGGAKLEASEFASLVPTLARPSNWIQWRNHFKYALQEASPLHWAIVEGSYHYPLFASRVEAAGGFTEETRPKPTGEWIGHAIRRWEQTNTQARDYLLATMDPEPASHIVNIALAKDIWSAMNDFYRSENATANVCHQWRRWTSLRYVGTGNEDKNRFMCRFRCALDDLRELKIEVPPSVVLALQRPRATVST